MKKPALLKVLVVILGFALALVGMAGETVAINIGDASFAVDVWTNRGGQGAGVAGGIYEVGEDIIIYFQANEDCQASITISGPSMGYPGQLMDAVLYAGETYEFPLGEAEEIDIGQWEITIGGCIDEGCATDTTWLTVVAAQPPPTPLTVDVWTDKGGQGANVAGGIYEVGEETIIYLKANQDCQASITISGPSIGYPGQLVDAMLEAGETYTLPLGEGEEIDIGQWEISIDAATEEGQYSSDSTSFTVVAAEPPLIPLSVDVWTDKGGRGSNMAGGTYEVGEEITFYVEVTTSCQATWTLNGPAGIDSGQQMMDAGTYELDMGRAEEGDVGRWEMAFEVWNDEESASDRTWFSIITVEPEPIPTPTPTPTPSPTPSEPEERPIPKIDASNATELYALMALKMSEGALPLDLNLDANGDGQVTREDARLILTWAVEGI